MRAAALAIVTTLASLITITGCKKLETEREYAGGAFLASRTGLETWPNASLFFQRVTATGFADITGSYDRFTELAQNDQYLFLGSRLSGDLDHLIVFLVAADGTFARILPRPGDGNFITLAAKSVGTPIGPLTTLRGVAKPGKATLYAAFGDHTLPADIAARIATLCPRGGEICRAPLATAGSPLVLLQRLIAIRAANSSETDEERLKKTFGRPSADTSEPALP